MHQSVLQQIHPAEGEVEVQKVNEAELDEMWGFIGNKAHQCWLWYATGHLTGAVLAYVLGTCEDEVFLQLKEMLNSFGTSCFYTDAAGVYERHLEGATHEVGREQTQKIERKHLTLCTRIKRLARKTICFSKSVLMHDVVIGLFVNRYEFGLPI